jgi:hypothetical protein
MRDDEYTLELDERIMDADKEESEVKSPDKIIFQKTSEHVRIPSFPFNVEK